MSPKTITRQARDRARGQLRAQLTDAICDYDALLAGTEPALRDSIAERIFRHQESLHAAITALDQYETLKRHCAPG
jgi:hypothetical protein